MTKIKGNDLVSSSIGARADRCVMKALALAVTNKFGINDVVWYEENNLITSLRITNISLCDSDSIDSYVQFNSRIPEIICFSTKDAAIDNSIKRLGQQRG